MANLCIHLVDKNHNPLEGLAVCADFFDEAEDMWRGAATVYSDEEGYARFHGYNAEWSILPTIDQKQYEKQKWKDGECIRITHSHYNNWEDK